MKKFSLSLICVFWCFGVFAQDVYVALDTKAPRKEAESALIKAGVSEAKIVYGRYIYRKNYPYLMEKSLTANIKKLFPNPDAKGIGVIDWEGAGYDDLMGKNGLDAFNKVFPEFERALSIAKKLRPNVKWGFYGIPFRSSYGGVLKDDHVWKKSNERIIRLMSQSDVLLPVFYDSHNDPDFSASLKVLEKEYIMSLEYGKMTGKKIIPVIWHRYHKTVKEAKTPLMSAEHFKQILTMIQQKKTERLGGILWWAGEDIFAKRDTQQIRARTNVGTTSYNALLKSYLGYFDIFK